jgi:hypothetical protein
MADEPGRTTMNCGKVGITFLLVCALFGAPGLSTPPAAPQPAPDFYLIMDRCSTTIGYHAQSDASLKVFDDDPINSACERHSQTIVCVLASPDGSPLVKGALAEYSLLLDSPPLLHFGAANGAEFVAVDTDSHTAVVISRVIQPKFAGSKVCWGRFTTESERKLLSGDR